MNTRVEDRGPGWAGPLKLDELQRDLALPLVRSFTDSAPARGGRDGYAMLEDAIAKMEVPAELVGTLGAIVEVALATGRVRSVFGPAAELSLTALLKKTPRGEAIGESLRALNRALAKLKDQPLSEVSAAFRKPGVYTLAIAAGGFRIVVRFDSDGAAIESVETDAG